MADARMPIATGPLHRSGELVGVERVQHLFERHPDLEAGQVRAQAEVGAVAEREVRIRVACEAELVRRDELPLVAVGRALPDHDLLPGFNGLAAEPAPD